MNTKLKSVIKILKDKMENRTDVYQEATKFFYQKK